jgi:deazaflavin-dependent oxidoreductase (nitroreductase family)
MSDWNDRIIAEFRAHDGIVGGPFAGGRLLLLHTTGAKSGETRVVPVMYFDEDDTLYVVASKAGAPTHPGWYHNIVANPTVTVERGGTGTGIQTFEGTAVTVHGPRRDELFARVATTNPGFAEYQQKTDRVLPVVAITRNA